MVEGNANGVFGAFTKQNDSLAVLLLEGDFFFFQLVTVH